MKILVIGGMHGNEPLGQEVVALLQVNPVAQVDTLLANQQAIAANARFVGNDLNRCFPGDSSSQDYETKRAATILAECQKYDVVLDFHNTHCPDNDCGFVGQAAAPQLYDVAAWLGLQRIVVAEYDCINKYAPNCLSVEVSLSSQLMSASDWYAKIAALATKTTLEPAANMELYSFVYRMTLADRRRLKLDAQQLRAFKQIDDELARAMGVECPAYPIFIGDKYTPYNFGGLLRKKS